MVERLTFTRKHSFNTRSNKVKKIRTPGGRLVFQYIKKRANKPKCGDCKQDLVSIHAFRPKELRQLDKSQRTVSRAYGGSRCHKCVRTRIIRAFLVEEQKIVKAVLKQRARQEAQTAKSGKQK